VRYDEWGRDKARPIITLTNDQREKSYVYVQGEEIRLSSIPMEIRGQIVDALVAKGHAVTQYDIAAWWVKAGRPK
jgi:hypothetical protein